MSLLPCNLTQCAVSRDLLFQHNASGYVGSSPSLCILTYLFCQWKNFILGVISLHFAYFFSLFPANFLSNFHLLFRFTSSEQSYNTCKEFSMFNFLLQYHDQFIVQCISSVVQSWIPIDTCCYVQMLLHRIPSPCQSPKPMDLFPPSEW